MMIERLSDLWRPELWADGLLALSFTLVGYAVGMWCYRRSGNHPLLQPLIVASLLIAAVIYVFPINNDQYFQGNLILYHALGPATVALAVPLYQQLPRIKAIWLPVLSLLIIGSVVATAIAVLLAWGMQGSEFFIKSIAAKSVTTPIAMQITQISGGDAALAAAVVVLTGVAGALGAEFIFDRLKIKDPRLKGLVLGICAHGVGTAKAFEISPVAGAFSSVALGLCGVMAAFILPIILLQY